LQAKCCVNMGRPRRAWISIRRAHDQSILLGLHNGGSHTDLDDVNTWATICGYESQLSLLLGVPQVASCAGIQNTVCGAPQEVAVMQRINLLCIQINERNQNHQSSTYADTLKLDECLDDLRAMIPPDWWNMHGVEKLPLEVFHIRQTAKLYFFHLKQTTHLPYMLQAVQERKYEYSRESVFEAAEGIIRCYEERRLHGDGQYIMCFLVDFLAFSAGLVLATDLVSQRSMHTQASREKNWQLIASLICELQHAADLLEHTVATQAAQLLIYLYSSCHGSYDGPDIYEAVVPYFGKVCIKRPHILDPSPAVTLCSSAAETKEQPNTVEFDSNMFGFGRSGAFVDTELDVDWTALLDDHITYDWNSIVDL
jgi:hypothetical protein